MSWREDDIVRELKSIDPMQRSCLLTLSLIELNSRDVKAAIGGMLAVIEKMTQLHSTPVRFAISDLLRDTADRCERSLNDVK